MTDEKLQRINALARKQREIGLTPQEQEEQKRLRQEYIAAFRGDLKRQLDSLVIVDPSGNRRKVHPKSQKGLDCDKREEKGKSFGK